MSYYEECRTKMDSFVSKLEDEESRLLFDAKYQLFIDRDIDKFYDKLDEYLGMKNRIYAWHMLDEFYRINGHGKDKPIVVFGAGPMGRRAAMSLKYYGKNVLYFCDNDKGLHGRSFAEKTVYGIDKLMEDYRKSDFIIMLATKANNQVQIFHQLIKLGVKNEDIWMPESVHTFCNVIKQYFDLPALYEHLDPNGEIFVDAGAFNGMTTVNFEKNFNLKKAYVFEPARVNHDACKKNLSSLKGEYELITCATWNEKAQLRFAENTELGSGSLISSGGKVLVDADSIDNVLAGRKATFIKMDVEGAELKSLQGAEKTIKEFRPKLAICIYHKPEDIVQIPCFIEKLGMDYRYYIRHYQTILHETVLYAV